MPAKAAPPRRRPHLRCILRRVLDRGRQRFRYLVGHGLAERRGKGGRGLADKIGLGDAREIGTQRLDAALLLQAARYPVDAREAGKGRCRRIGVRRLGIIDEKHIALAADLFHAVRQARKALQAGLDLAEIEPDPEAGRDRGKRVLRIVLAAQRADALQEGDAAVTPLDRFHQAGAVGEITVGQRQPLGDADDLISGLFQPVGDLGAIDVVDADDCRIAAGNQPLLDRGVVLHRAVAVEMVGRQVEQDAGGRIDGGRKVDLVRGAFDHVEPVVGQRIKRHDGSADIAAHLGVAPRRLQDMRGERRGRRLSVGPGDRDEGRGRRLQDALTCEEFDVADDFHARAACQFHRPMRLGMRQRHARRQHEARKPAPVGRPQVARRNARGGGPVHAFRIVVPGEYLGSAFDQGVAGGNPRAAKPEERDLFSGKSARGDHLLPTAASGLTGRQAPG